MDYDEPEGTVHTVYAAELAGPIRRKAPQCHVSVNHQPMKALIDTRASINLMTHDLFNTLPDRPRLRQTHVQVYTFGTKTTAVRNVHRRYHA